MLSMFEYYSISCCIPDSSSSTSYKLQISREPKLATYDNLNEACGEFFSEWNLLSDPVRCMSRMAEVLTGTGMAAEDAGLPVRSPLGLDALQFVRNRCDAVLRVRDEWEDVIKTRTALRTPGQPYIMPQTMSNICQAECRTAAVQRIASIVHAL